MNAAIDVPAGGGCFEGHFPERPILPGVALLDLACQALAASGERQPLRAVVFARLRQTVTPGDRLSLSARTVDRQHTRVELRRGPELVANAELEFGPPRPAPSVQNAAFGAHSEVDLRVPLDALLPHRPPMRFVTSLIAQHPDGLTCRVCIPLACALVVDGFAPALAAVEAAAQTAAAWEAVRRLQAEAAASPRIGYLVALRDVSFYAARIPADRPLLARVQLEDMALPLTHYRFELSLAGATLATGLIATYLTPAQADG